MIKPLLQLHAHKEVGIQKFHAPYPETPGVRATDIRSNLEDFILLGKIINESRLLLPIARCRVLYKLMTALPHVSRSAQKTYRNRIRRPK